MRVSGPCVTLCVVLFGCSGDDDESDVEFFSTACPAVDACGGDPSGTWAVVGGCVAESENPEDPEDDWCDGAADRAHGYVEGTFTFEGTSVSYELESTLYICGWVTEGSSGGSSTVDLEEGTVSIGGAPYDFCVDGDTLVLSNPNARDPDFATLRLERR